MINDTPSQVHYSSSVSSQYSTDERLTVLPTSPGRHTPVPSSVSTSPTPVSSSASTSHTPVSSSGSASYTPVSIGVSTSPTLYHSSHPVAISLPVSSAVTDPRQSYPDITSLNPSVLPFQPALTVPTAPTNPKTGTRKKTKQTPSTDPQGVENELNKYALNTAKAKICEQETEIKDLRFRNNILGQRISTLEKRVKDTIADQINSPQLSSNYCRQRHCCTPAPSAHYCCNNVNHRDDIELADKLEKAMKDISSQGKSLEELTTRLDNFFLQHDNKISTPKPLQAQQEDFPPHQSVSSCSVPKENRNMDTSVLSVDFAIANASLSEDNLNC